MEKQSVNKVVLAYSGGLDTSVIVSWLRENYDCEVICFTADIGQGEETADLPERAKASGASKLIQYDLREEFASEYLWPLIRSGAIYERKYLLGTSIARPLIAKYQVKVAEQEGADAVSHGCTGKGNDQVRFELTYTALNPRLKIIAPWREWNIRSREDAVNYLQRARLCRAHEQRLVALQPRPQPVASFARGRPAGKCQQRAGRCALPAVCDSAAGAGRAGRCHASRSRRAMRWP